MANKLWSTTIQLSTIYNEKNIEKFIYDAYDLDFLCLFYNPEKDWYDELSLAKAVGKINSPSNDPKSILIRDNDYSDVIYNTTFFPRNNFLTVYFHGYEYELMTDYFPFSLPNNIYVLHKGLDICRNFLLKNCEIDSEQKILYDKNNENCIEIVAFWGNDSEDIKILSDIIIRNNYKVLDEKTNLIVSDSEKISLLIDKFLFEKGNDLILNVDDYKLKITKKDTILIYPVESYKLKFIENESHIDLEFYLRVVLNLLEPFGIYELKTYFDGQGIQ